MIAEQRLISQIREFVNGLEQEPSTSEHDLAEQFAQLCRTFNGRLAKCEGLLEKGLRSEAVQEALSPPSLFQLRELLETPEIRKWRNMCLDFGMTAPPELNFDTIDRLREECSTEQLLQPLLRKFRRLVHEGTLEERVQILRQLRVHDPDNPVWIENLEPLERRQLQDIDKRADAAIAENDIETLRDIYEDLTDPRRLIKPGNELIEKVDAFLRKEREEEAMEEGRELAAKLGEAHDAEDYDRLEKLIGQWRRLERFADFHPDEEMEGTANAARNWFENETQRRESEQHFNEALDRLRTVLERPGVDRQTLEQAWDHVHTFNRPLDSSLEESVPERIAELRAEEQRRLRRKRAIATVCIIFGLGIISAAGWFGWRTLQLNRHEEQLRAMWQRRQTSEMASYLERLEENSPAMYASPQVQQYENMLAEFMEAEDARLASLEDAMTHLQEVRSEGYAASSTRINTLLDNARSLAETSDEQRRIENWEQNWQTWRDRRQEERDSRFTDLKQELQKAIDRLETESETMTLDAMERRVTEAERIAAEARELAPRVSDSARGGWQPLLDGLDTWQNRVAQERERLQAAAGKRRNFLRSLEEQVRDLANYSKSITAFLAEYPEIEEAEELRRTVEQIPAYRDALALNGITLPAMPFDAAGAAPFVTARQNLEEGNTSAWYKDLSKCIDYSARATEVRRDMNRLRSLRFWDWKELRYRPKGEDQWTVVYTPKAILSREETADDGTQYMLYWGEVFQTSNDTYNPWLERIRLDSREYEIEWNERPEDNLIPAAQYGRRMLASIPEDRYLEDFLLEQIAELLANEEVAPVPKAELIARLAEYADQACPFEGVRMNALRNVFKEANLKSPWINAEHPRVRAEVAAIRALLGDLKADRLQQMQQALDFNRWLLVSTLNRDLRIAGVIKKDLDSGQLFPEVFGLNPGSLRCVLPGREGIPNSFYVLVEQEEGGEYRIPAVARRRAFTGQILLAPADGKTPAEFVEDAPPLPEGFTPDWPAGWPLNAK